MASSAGAEHAQDFDWDAAAAVLTVHERVVDDALPAFAADPFNRELQEKLLRFLQSDVLADATSFYEQQQRVQGAA